jgi:hypothetical protein
MSDQIVYGVDTSKEVTPLQVREALVQCFINAHRDSLEVPEGSDEEAIQSMILLRIKKAFSDSGGDFENPTKMSLLKAIVSLKEFSSSFRNQEVIAEHFNAIKFLIDSIE